MRGKLALVVGLATGYVLGTRDGRARYEQIKSQATRVVQDPRVREKAAQAGDLAKDKAPLVRDKVADVASQAGSKVGSSSSGTDQDMPAQTSASGPDLSHSTAGTSDTTESAAGTSSSGASREDSADEDAIVLTPPSPSPLAPGPTQGSASNGGQDG